MDFTGTASIINTYDVILTINNCFRLQKTATYSNNRFLNTSRVCWASQVVKVPPFAESVTEGDVR